MSLIDSLQVIVLNTHQKCCKDGETISHRRTVCRLRRFDSNESEDRGAVIYMTEQPQQNPELQHWPTRQCFFRRITLPGL